MHKPTTLADIGITYGEDCTVRILVSMQGLISTHGMSIDVRVPASQCYIGTQPPIEKNGPLDRHHLGVTLIRSRTKWMRLYLQLPWKSIALDLKRYPALIDRYLPQRRALYTTRLLGGDDVCVVVWSKRENVGLPPVYSQNEWHAQKRW